MPADFEEFTDKYKFFMNVCRLLAIKSCRSPSTHRFHGEDLGLSQEVVDGLQQVKMKLEVAPGVVKQPSCELCMVYDDDDVRSPAMDLVRMRGISLAASLKGHCAATPETRILFLGT